ncbi:hypothetical protein A2368_03170 [Candidatus Collierbacteria bacterium RIFOXYB1_FULL_49_13]|uniref:N-acetyltransferase domain-containing protein n=1 Tax=Candidatus Collierbacteria bacterium RIFOXYB1_FULL_49_13 TaxID=1817728 RepID=A0A1F5FJR3_9BACT|nr:MAG: hypothetical protein A2368_03170 [Candidatus Collierbacteria bacterium RIFOXYB1_FULL_49_13]
MSRYAEILSLSQDLVRIPSETGRRQETVATLELVRAYLGERYQPKIYESNGIVSYLWGDPDTLQCPRLLLSGHIDVVAAQPSQYQPVVAGDLLLGRGSGDMKGHVAAMVDAYKLYLDEGGHGVGMLLTGDEEKGGFDGTKYVVDQGLRPTVVLVPDGSFDFNIVLKQKAPHHVRLRGMGPGGHGSLAFEVDNPLDRLIHFYTEMQAEYAKATKEDSWHSTFEMTKVWTPVPGMPDDPDTPESPNSENSIPTRINAWFSWRWPLEEFSFAQAMARLDELCQKYGLEKVAEHGFGLGCNTDPNDPAVVEWKQTIESVLGREVGYDLMHAATDGRFFFDKGAVVITTSAKTGKHHAEEGEWVDIPSLVKLSEAIYQFQKKLDSQADLIDDRRSRRILSEIELGKAAEYHALQSLLDEKGVVISSSGNNQILQLNSADFDTIKQKIGLALLANTCFETDMGLPGVKIAADPAGYLNFLKVDGELVGFLGSKVVTDEYGRTVFYMDIVGTMPSHQGRGWGKYLGKSSLDHVIGQSGADVVFLTRTQNPMVVAAARSIIPAGATLAPFDGEPNQQTADSINWMVDHGHLSRNNRPDSRFDAHESLIAWGAYGRVGDGSTWEDMTKQFKYLDWNSPAARMIDAYYQAHGTNLEEAKVQGHALVLGSLIKKSNY